MNDIFVQEINYHIKHLYREAESVLWQNLHCESCMFFFDIKEYLLAVPAIFMCNRAYYATFKCYILSQNIVTMHV